MKKEHLVTPPGRQSFVLFFFLIFIISAACSVSNIIEQLFASPFGIDERIENVEKELDPEYCFTTGAEFEEFWTHSIYEGLAWSGRTCSTGAINAYKNCLKTNILQGGMCYAEAEGACQVEYESIPPNFPAGIAQFPLDATHSEAEDVMGLMELDEWGSVEGFLWLTLKDKHLCTIGVEANFQGEFDVDSCTMSGSALLDYLYEGTACASVCGSGPDSETPCPVTISGETTWEATLENGKLMGGVGGEDCDPGCVGFWAEP